MSKYGEIVKTDAELKPCPFCGGKGYIIMVQNRFYATCDTCTCRIASDCLDLRYYGDVLAEVIEAWNTRAERTCEVLGEDYDELLEYWNTELSCGHAFNGMAKYVNYCPECGAKVVSE